MKTVMNSALPSNVGKRELTVQLLVQTGACLKLQLQLLQFSSSASGAAF